MASRQSTALAWFKAMLRLRNQGRRLPTADLCRAACVVELYWGQDGARDYDSMATPWLVRGFRSEADVICWLRDVAHERGPDWQDEVTGALDDTVGGPQDG